VALPSADVIPITNQQTKERKMPKTKKEKIVAERLCELRLENDLTQEQLAQASGIDRKTVNRIENGHFSPNLDTLFRLCEAIGVKPAELFVGIK